MNRIMRIFAALSTLVIAALWAVPVSAQAPEVKEKPPLYTYVSFWTIPRAQWPDMAKTDADDKPVMDKAIAAGTIVAYGNDTSVLHQVDGDTHADWWSSMSIAGLLDTLRQVDTPARSSSPALRSATSYWNHIIVARYYGWRPGSWQGIYTYAGFYQLKPDAPDDAVELLSKNLLAPLFAKLLADGVLNEWEIDTEVLHTDTHGRLWIFCLAANSDAIDKVNAALHDAVKSNPLGAVAFHSMVDVAAHRDYMALADATYK